MSTVEKRTAAAKSPTSSSPTKKSKSAAAAAATTTSMGMEDSHERMLLKMMKTASSEILVHPARSISVSGVLHCEKDDLLPSILKTLDEQKILALPVCLRRDNIFIGFIEIQDIVTYIARHFANTKLTTFDEFQRMWDEMDAFNITTVQEVMDNANTKVAPVHPVPAGYTLFHAFEMLARNGFHRTAVVNENGQIRTIITQSMMIDYLHSNMDLLGQSYRHRSVGSLVNLHPGVPITVKQTDRMLRAFQLMTLHSVSGVGVVDEAGKLVDVVSARDLRGTPLNAVSYYGLYSSVKEWKESVRMNYPKTVKFVVTVRNEDTWEHVVQEMSTHKVHRVFVVDEDGKPVKCIAQKDMLYNLLQVPSEAS